MSRKTKLLSVVLMVVVLSFIFINDSSFDSNALSKFSSSGSEVRAIQTRLSNWGYYNGAIDGVYGSKTVTAVKKFQRAHGLTDDGIAGPATLTKIGIFSGSSKTDSSAVNLLAMAINGEARGEPYVGQVAVGAVILNRVEHSSFPNTIAGVIYQPGAFTAVADGQINAGLVDSCVRAARDALNGWDPVGGAIYYYNPVTATNQWIRGRPIVSTIGKHVFCY